MKRIIGLILIVSIVFQLALVLPAGAAQEQMLTEQTDIFDKITHFYCKSLEYANKTTFDGYCAFYVNCQLFLLKINREYVAGNGNQEFDNYRYKKKSNGGYDIAAYAASKYTLVGALNEISQNGTKDVYNILVGFQKGQSAAGKKYGHTCFIHAILDGIVYYSDSMEVVIGEKTYPEGAPITCTIEEFGAVYKKWTLDGLIHFTYEEHTCDAGELLFYGSQHPHYPFYQCSVCGQVWKDTALETYSDACYVCNYPSEPALHPLNRWYLEWEGIELAWDPTELTTGYVLVMEMKDSSGAYVACCQVETDDTSAVFALEEGAYRVKLRAINENGHVLGGTDPAYVDSPWVHFEVTSQWDCNIHGHELTLREYLPATCTEAGHTIYDCARCVDGVQEIHHPYGHRFDTGKITVEPTQDFPGELVCTCAACGEQRFEPLAALGDNPFVDLEVDDYYYLGALWAYWEDITTGATETEFLPRNTATRGQVVTFLWRSMGCPEAETTLEDWGFTDIDWESYYAPAVLWALEQGITKGVSSTRFAPNDPVTRGQFVTFLHRLAGQPKTECGTVFADVKKDAYYEDAVLWATRNSITNGMSSTRFSPNAPCTRGQIVTFLYRYFHWL